MYSVFHFSFSFLRYYDYCNYWGYIPSLVPFPPPQHNFHVHSHLWPQLKFKSPQCRGFAGLATKPRAQWAHCYAPTAALDFRAINSCRSEMSWTPSINHRPPSSGDKTNNSQPNVQPRVKPGAEKKPTQTRAANTTSRIKEKKQNRGLVPLLTGG